METTRTDRFKTARRETESRRSSGMPLLPMLNGSSVGYCGGDSGLNVRSPVSRRGTARPASWKRRVTLPYAPPRILANQRSLWLRNPCDSVYWQPDDRS